LNAVPSFEQEVSAVDEPLELLSPRLCLRRLRPGLRREWLERAGCATPGEPNAE
jgi:hypothetical protein